MTPLETTLVEAARTVHSSAFGERLRAYRKSRQGPGFKSELAMFETGGGMAPLIRTASIVAILRATRGSVPLEGSEEGEYVAWIEEALDGVNRLSTRLWDTVLPGPRQLVVDEDDLPQWATGYPVGGRYDTSARGFAAVGYSSEAIAATGRLADSLTDTDCFRAARRAAAEIYRNSELRQELEAVRQRVLDALPPKKQETLEDARRRVQRLVSDAYEASGRRVQGVAAAIRALNQLINNVLWAILQAAEAEDAIPVLSADLRMVRATHAPRSLVVRFSTASGLLPWLGPPAPFELRLGCPLDGVYLVSRSHHQGGAAWLHDIEAWSLRELELGPASIE